MQRWTLVRPVDRPPDPPLLWLLVSHHCGRLARLRVWCRPVHRAAQARRRIIGYQIILLRASPLPEGGRNSFLSSLGVSPLTSVVCDPDFTSRVVFHVCVALHLGRVVSFLSSSSVVYLASVPIATPVSCQGLISYSTIASSWVVSYITTIALSTGSSDLLTREPSTTDHRPLAVAHVTPLALSVTSVTVLKATFSICGISVYCTRGAQCSAFWGFRHRQLCSPEVPGCPYCTFQQPSSDRHRPSRRPGAHRLLTVNVPARFT